MSEALTIVGASVRAAAQSALRAGIAPLAGDLFADVDLVACCPARRVARYPHGLLSVVAGPQAGPWMYTGALENHPALVARMAEVRPLLGCGAAVLQEVRDPVRLAAVLAAAGLPALEVRTSPAELPRDGSFLRKPLRSAAGHHIAPVRGELRDDASREWYYQRYAAGESCAAVYVAAQGRGVLLGVTRQLVGTPWSGAARFAYAGSIGPLNLSATLERGFTELGSCLAEQFALEGLFGVDAIVAGESVWPVEVNPRYTASAEIVERAIEQSVVGLHVAACRDGKLPAAPRPQTSRCYGKAVLYALEATGVGQPAVERLLELAGKKPGAWADWPRVADIPAAGSSVRRGAPLVTCFADGMDEHQTLERLEAQAAEIRRMLAGTNAQ